MKNDKSPTLEPYTMSELYEVLGQIERGTYKHETVRRLAHTALSVMETWYSVYLGNGKYVIKPDGETLRYQTLMEAKQVAEQFKSAGREYGSDYVLIYQGDEVVDKVFVWDAK